MTKRRILREVREQLIGRLESLQGSLQRTVVRMKGDPGNQADILDQAVTEQDRTLELTIRFHESRQIPDIQEAIRRIDHGCFGICDQCGKPIAQKRLLLAPLSRLCTPCKARLELRGGRHGWGGERDVENHAA